MSDRPIRSNPDNQTILLIAIVAGIGLVLWGKSAVKASGFGTQFEGVDFDKLYRLGEDMNILWRFSHKGAAEEIELVFSVGSVPFYGQPIDTAPIQDLTKHVQLNEDEKWTLYEIEHKWPLDRLPGRGFYTVTNYILSESGAILDKKTSGWNMFAT